MQAVVTRFTVPNTEEEAAAAHGPAGTGAPVLLVLHGESYPIAALRRAASLARLLGEELHAVRVLPDGVSMRPLFPHLCTQELLRGVELTLSVDATTRDWLDTIESAAVAERLTLVRGAFIDTVVGRALELGAQLVVIDASDEGGGSAATSIACESGVPTLVVRDTVGEDCIIAATDLTVPNAPVLEVAANLARAVHAEVVAVHALRGGAAGVHVHTHARLPVSATDPQSKLELDHVAQELPGSVEAVVRSERNPTDGILAEARLRCADMIVVGARPDPSAGPHAHCVAAEVVRRARRSVLVAPLCA